MSSNRPLPNTPASLWKTYIGSFAAYANAAAITSLIGSRSALTDDPGPIGSLLLAGGSPGTSPKSQQSYTGFQPSSVRRSRLKCHVAMSAAESRYTCSNPFVLPSSGQSWFDVMAM